MNTNLHSIPIFRLLVYIVIVLLTGIAIGAAHFINSIAVNERVFTFLQLAGILFIGWQHIKITNTLHLKIFSPRSFKGLVITLLLSVALILSLWCLKHLNITNQLLIPAFAGAAFLLPSVLNSAYSVFNNIPDIQLQPWYKLDNLIDNKSFVFLSTIPIQIKVQTNVLNTTYTHFTCTVPGHFELGKIYHYFLIQQQINNTPIETQDDDGEPYGWHFYLEKKWFPLVALDPEKNLLDSHVKSNATIIAKRIMPTAEFLFKPIIKNHRYELHQ